MNEPLIKVPDDCRRNPIDRLTRILVLSLCGLVVIGTTLVNALFPVPDPDLIGEEKNEQAKMRASARLGDGSLARLVEFDLRVTSRVRRLVLKPYATFLFKHLQEVRGSALLGKEGWLFLTARARPPELASTVIAERGAMVLSAVDRRLSSLGSRLLLAPIPRKSVVYEQFLPRGVDPRGEIETLFMEELAKRRVDTVDLPALFRREKEQILYYPTGTHWTQTGEVVAAAAFIEHAGLLAPEAERHTELRMVGLRPRASRRDLLRFLEVELDAEYEAELRSLELKYYGVFDSEGEIFSTSDTSFGRLAIAGTSFTAGSQFPELLSHFSQKPIWNASLPAVHALTSLLDLTRISAERNLPERIFLELPVHQIFRPPPPTAGELFAENPPRESTVVVPGQYFVTHAESDLGKIRLHQQTVVLATVPASHLAHSGAGVVAVRLRGAVKSGEVRIKIGSEPFLLRTPWREGVSEIVLPVLSPRGEIVIAAESLERGVLVVESLEIVVGLSSEHAVLGAVAELRSDDDGWQQRIHFPTGPLIAKHDALLIELAASGTVSPVEVQIDSVGETVHPYSRVATLDTDASLVIDLGMAAGRMLESVTLRGQGETPETLVGRGRLLSAARPGTQRSAI